GSGSAAGKRSRTQAAMRATSSSSGGSSTSGSATGPAWCAPALMPYPGSCSAYIAWWRVASSSSTTDGIGGPSQEKYATVSRVTRTWRSGTSCDAHAPAVTTTTSASTSSSRDSTRRCSTGVSPRNAASAPSALTTPASGCQSATQPGGGTTPSPRSSSASSRRCSRPRPASTSRELTSTLEQSSTSPCSARSSAPVSPSRSRQPASASSASPTQCASGYASRKMRERP